MAEWIIAEGMYTWFKQYGVVEHFMDVGSRYSRAGILFQERRLDAIGYLGAWIARFRELRERLPFFIQNDADWESMDIRAVFEYQIDWCIEFFSNCLEMIANVAKMDRFQTFEMVVKNVWKRLVDCKAPSGRIPERRSYVNGDI